MVDLPNLADHVGRGRVERLLPAGPDQFAGLFVTGPEPDRRGRHKTGHRDVEAKPVACVQRCQGTRNEGWAVEQPYALAVAPPVGPRWAARGQQGVFDEKCRRNAHNVPAATVTDGRNCGLIHIPVAATARRMPTTTRPAISGPDG